MIHVALRVRSIKEAEYLAKCDFMWQIRQSLYENYGITVLQNLEKFQEYTGTDELDKQYYELVANAFSNPKTEQKHNSNTRFYIQKRTPFYVGKERYFEVTLQQADIYASKYNRITAYTQLDISTGYSVQIDYVPSFIMKSFRMEMLLVLQHNPQQSYRYKLFVTEFRKQYNIKS